MLKKVIWVGFNHVYLASSFFLVTPPCKFYFSGLFLVINLSDKEHGNHRNLEFFIQKATNGHSEIIFINCLAFLRIGALLLISYITLWHC